MALRGVVLIGRAPQRTCVGCRGVDAQAALVRVAYVGPRLITGRGPGRGAYVHARPRCIEAASHGGLARSLRRGVPTDDVREIDWHMSRAGDNSQTCQKAAGLSPAEAVETPPRTEAGRAEPDPRERDGVGRAEPDPRER